MVSKILLQNQFLSKILFIFRFEYKKKLLKSITDTIVNCETQQKKTNLADGATLLGFICSDDMMTVKWQTQSTRSLNMVYVLWLEMGFIKYTKQKMTLIM